MIPWKPKKVILNEEEEDKKKEKNYENEGRR